MHNSRISYEAEWIRQHYNDAFAIDMEAAGVAQAGHLNGSPVAIVRGISDRADGTKTTDADGSVTNIAAHSVVGIQAKNVTNSDVQVNASQPQASVDLAADLAAVRTELEQARSTGTLDALTYDNAQEELCLAEKTLHENTNQSKNTLLLTLRRLRGLVMDAAEVASKVATLITAVKDLS